MPGGRRSAISNVPAEIMAEVDRLRAFSGPDIIYQKVPQLAEYGVTYDGLKNYIYGRGAKRGQAPPLSVERLGRIADLLERSGIKPEDIGQVKSVRLSDYQMLTKDADGDAEIHDLQAAAVLLTPAWETGPAWQPIDRGPAVKLPRRPSITPSVSQGWQRCFLWPDTQVGYRRDIDTMELEPFHDEVAIACALALLRKVAPEKVIIFGDFLDLPEFGTFEQEAGFALTVQPAIDRATTLLAQIRQAAPSAEIVFIEGNHDRRLQKAVLRNALAAFGIKRGNSAPDDWPVLSVPYLLRMDEMNVSYVGGYPAGLVWINENLAAIHGAKVNSAGSTALRVVDDSRVSVVFGHVHRIELMHKTRQTFQGAKRNFAATMGCLCRIDGAVPSTKGSTDVFGRSVPTVEQWQHGVGVVTFQPGDGLFHLDLIPIQDGTAVLFGKAVSVGAG